MSRCCRALSSVGLLWSSAGLLWSSAGWLWSSAGLLWSLEKLSLFLELLLWLLERLSSLLLLSLLVYLQKILCLLSGNGRHFDILVIPVSLEYLIILLLFVNRRL